MKMMSGAFRSGLLVMVLALPLSGVRAEELDQASQAEEPVMQARLDAAHEALAEGAVTVAEQIYRELAEQGSVEAMIGLGYIYDWSELNVQAVEWYRAAAETGDPLGQQRLGEMYAKGEGVAADMAVAREWYVKAAEQGLGSAARVLWVNAEKGGLGLAADPAEAIRWLEAAVAAEDKPSIKRLAKAYRLGELGLAINGARATELEALLKKGAK